MADLGSIAAAKAAVDAAHQFVYPTGLVDAGAVSVALKNALDTIDGEFARRMAVAASAFGVVEGGVDVFTPTVGATSGLQTLDGVAGAVNLKVLVGDRGAYLMKTGAWVRLTGYTTWESLRLGTWCSVDRGTVYGGTLMAQSGVIASLTDAQAWKQVSRLSRAMPSVVEEQLDFPLTPGQTVFTLPVPYLADLRKVFYQNFMQGGPLKKSQYDYDPQTGEIELFPGDYEIQPGDEITVFYLVTAPPVYQQTPGTWSLTPDVTNNAGVVTITDASGTYKIPARKV